MQKATQVSSVSTFLVFISIILKNTLDVSPLLTTCSHSIHTNYRYIKSTCGATPLLVLCEKNSTFRTRQISMSISSPHVLFGIICFLFRDTRDTPHKHLHRRLHCFLVLPLAQNTPLFPTVYMVVYHDMMAAFRAN